MATKKGGASKGGSKKGGASKGGSSKGGSKKGGSKGGSKKGGRGASKRGLSSVLSTIGTVASTVGSVAGTVGGLTGSRRELRLSVPPDASLTVITAELKKKFREAGCPGCRSGIDRFTFQDIASKGGGGGFGG